MTRYRFPAPRRIKKTAEFSLVYQQGRKAAGRFMVVWGRREAGIGWRAGVVASKKVGGAVVRNRVKRRLRELIRLHQHRFAEDRQIVVVARASLADASWEELICEFLELCDKTGGLIKTASQAPVLSQA